MSTADSMSFEASNAPEDAPEVDDAQVVCAGVVIAALRRSARPGDASVIPSIEALLRHGAGATARSQQPVSVRLAASIHAATDGLLHDSCDVVRLAALSALQRLWVRGDPDAMA